MSPLSRRALARLGSLAALGTLATLLPARPAHTPDATFPLLRRRWREVTAVPYAGRVEQAAAGHRASMRPARGGLWADLPYPSLDDTPARLQTMARAHAITGDPGLAEATAEGLAHYVRHVYAEGAEPVGNWWDWEIGVPRKLLDAAVLIGSRDRALAEAVRHFVPDNRLRAYRGRSTGANRVDLCLVRLLRAIVVEEPDEVRRAAEALTPVFRYVEKGDGFYRDGSFLQHTTIPYQGGYGAVLLSGAAIMLALVRGTPWEVDGRFLFDQVERSFAPFVLDGLCMDLVSGRGIARRPYGDHRRGQAIASAVLLLGESAPAAERARWRSLVKGWAERGGYRAGFEDLLADASVPAAPEPVGHRLFPMSARAVHRRPGWTAALSMSSYRIGHYEHGNGENLRGWHTGSGMLYWWAAGQRDHYSDFWHTVDPYRLPGTTVSTRRLADGAGRGWGDTRTKWRWVGGASDGSYAIVGQHLAGLGSTLEAFKAWVFLDEAVVCLGAGITCSDGVAVETVVDNRRSAAQPAEGAGWAHLAGHAGYLGEGFRTAGERGYRTFWFDHGVDPRGAGYRYVCCPGPPRPARGSWPGSAGWRCRRTPTPSRRCGSRRSGSPRSPSGSRGRPAASRPRGPARCCSGAGGSPSPIRGTSSPS